MNYLLWEQCWIPGQCLRDCIDVFHSPVHFGLPQITRSKCVLTLHDAIDEVYYDARLKKKSLSQRVTASLSRMARFRADHILTVSEYSRLDLIRHFGIPEDKISVVHEAADRRFHGDVTAAERARVREKYRLPARFLFYVGSLEPRKNIPFLLRALAAAGVRDMSLVLGGGSVGEQQELLRLAKELSIAHQVLTVGRIDDRDLPAFYAEAHCFVYPSEYEGFGLQICEAMATGCPVLASRASCLPEILGGGGETFSLADPSELIQSLRTLSSDNAYREKLRQNALSRSRFFSWTRTAGETLNLYARLCRDPRQRRCG
jgi:glycosyltransferase involved in cell wall biosynthesis